MADEVHDCSEMAKVPSSSASTSSFSEGVIINNNSGKQGDVFTNVGSVTKDVGGDVYNNLHVVGVFNCGEKKKLPPTPPRFVVLKAKYNGKCLRLTENDDGDFPAGYLKFEGRGREFASPQAKFELETAKIGHEFVHIRCCYNNKYLVRYDATAWIVAAADKPEEDESKMSCTLFELEWVNKSGREFRFRHIQRKSYACVWRCRGTCRDSINGRKCHGGLCIGMDEDDAYIVVPWESLVETMNKAVVQVPKFVALKGMLKNTKYLSLTTTNDPLLPAGILDFEGEEVAKFEMERAKSENGLVHIRCCENNKYLVRDNITCICCHEKFNNPYLIVAAADKPEEDEYKISCTLFEPELYDESGEPKFRFCHVHLGRRRYACTCRTRGGLHGDSNEPHKDACDVYRVVDLDGSG